MKFQIHEVVLAGNFKHKMIVVWAERLLKGWKYKLRFLTKTGKIDMRRSAWHYWEDEIESIN